MAVWTRHPPSDTSPRSLMPRASLSQLDRPMFLRQLSTDEYAPLPYSRREKLVVAKTRQRYTTLRGGVDESLSRFRNDKFFSSGIRKRGVLVRAQLSLRKRD